MTRSVIVLGAALLSVASWGQAGKTVKIDFPGEGDREVWLASGPSDTPAPQAASGLSITLTVPEGLSAGTAFVHDKKSGNVAAKPMAEILKTGTWKLAANEASRVYALRFVVLSEGKPVASAVVKAKAKGESREALLSPQDKGAASVHNLPVGPVEVVVQYKTASGTKSTPPQTFEAKLGAGPAEPKTITLPDKVETVSDEPSAPAATTAPTKGSEPAGEPKSAEPAERVPAPVNPLVSLLNIVIGLAVIGGICYGIYAYVKKNPKQVEDALKKVGLGDNPQQDAAPAPLPPQPQPIKPIDLGGAAPTAVVSPMAAPTATAVKNPRLVGADGSVAMITDGANVVGREEGLAIAIVGESSVSRHHATIDRSDAGTTLTDNGSTNGTYVNGAKIAAPTPLNPGDTVQFGARSFRYEE